MGVVYQAWDEELGIPVALKLIRPEILAQPEAGQQLERRFKRELVLARQVTHKNVVRIHDLGEFDGVKYLTMPFIEGQNLGMVLSRDGALPVARALRIARQVAAGLAAAHDVGVVHRDLKPENVMIDADDGAVIMDFGLARSSEAANITMSGAVLGTLSYMAPEQARGEVADQRADIYAWGLMLYDMVAGRRRSGQHGDPMSEMLSRMQQAPPPVRTLDRRVPEAVDQLITRCVQPDPVQRFQNVHEVIAALDALDGEGHPVVRSAVAQGTIAPPRSRRTLIMAAAVAVLSLAIGAGMWSNRKATASASVDREPISVLIADFENTTGDPLFNGTLEQALSLGIEGASFITAFPRRDAERAAQQIKPEAKLDETVARLVCQREGIKTMLAGSIAPAGKGFVVSIRVIDPVPGTPLATASETASSKSDVLSIVGKLSEKIRRALGDATPESAMIAGRETFTATTLEAARAYAEAQALANANRDEQALARYEQAIQQDPRLGRAYSGRAQSMFKLGRKDEAEASYQKAFTLLDRMTEREKFRTLGTYYLNIAGNYDKAIENNAALLAKYPADGAGHNNLALAYFHQLQFGKALEQGKQLLAIYPKSALYRYNQALYAMYAGDFAIAAEEARTALSINPNLPKAHLAIAMTAMAAGDMPEARAAYERARTAGARGISLANIGIADLAIYQGQFDEAVTQLERAIAEDEQGKNTAGAAAKAVALAEAQHARGNQPAVLAALDRAQKLGQDPAVMVPAANLYLQLGRTAEVARLADQLDAAIAPRSRAYARVVRAMLAIQRDRPSEALDLLNDAQKRADLWLVRYYKGIAYLGARAYPEALSEFEACVTRRGEATAVFLDDVPSYRYMVPLSYWLGRAHEALGAREPAHRHLRAYLGLRSPANDPLARDAAKRIGD